MREQEGREGRATFFPGFFFIVSLLASHRAWIAHDTKKFAAKGELWVGMIYSRPGNEIPFRFLAVTRSP